MQVEKTIYLNELTDTIPYPQALTQDDAKTLFHFFRSCPLFRWTDAHNDCEDRAHAACLLLSAWNIPACKAWVFSGNYLKKGFGQLSRQWNYHVAAALPVQTGYGIGFYVLDPATLSQPTLIAHWAENITDVPYSFHFVKESDVYIFNPSSFKHGSWYKQNRQNYKWTLQGLAGINGVSKTGKAQLVFRKGLLRKTQVAFEQMLHSRPNFSINGFVKTG